MADVRFCLLNARFYVRRGADNANTMTLGGLLEKGEVLAGDPTVHGVEEWLLREDCRTILYQFSLMKALDNDQDNEVTYLQVGHRREGGTLFAVALLLRGMRSALWCLSRRVHAWPLPHIRRFPG